MNVINILEKISFDWCASGNGGLRSVFHMLKILLNIIHIIVPIALIVMTSLDVAKKIINPDDKDGQKKIMIRAIAALIVFLTPTIVNFSLKIIDATSTDSHLSSCWDSA